MIVKGKSIFLKFNGIVKQRLDLFLFQELKKLGLSQENSPSRSQIGNWIGKGQIKVNGEVIKKTGHLLAVGSKLELNVPEPSKLSVEGEEGINYKIVYEDNYLIVIDKPAGLVVHPGAGNKKGTLVNALVSHLGAELKQIGDALRPGIVHRLDKDTSGLLVIAKTQEVFNSLVSQLKPPKKMKRVYWAICYRLPQKKEGAKISSSGLEGEVNLPIGRHPTVRTKMAVVKNGKVARTLWQVEKNFNKACLLKVSLDTGRTHQIRVHLSYCGAGIIGDVLYARVPENLPSKLKQILKKFPRQALHACELEFYHPILKREINFKSAMPEDMKNLLVELED